MSERQHWLVRCGEGGSVVDSCVMNGIAAVRFEQVGDVRERTRDQIVDELRGTPDKVGYEGLARDLIAFASDIEEGDIIVTSLKDRRRFLFGVVTSGYRWQEDSPVPTMRHLRDVEWRSSLAWDNAPVEFNSVIKYPRSIWKLTTPALVEHMERVVKNQQPISVLLAIDPKMSRSATTPSKDRPCATCGLRKAVGQFLGEGDVCVDCR